jgi:hypothetical protein
VAVVAESSSGGGGGGTLSIACARRAQKMRTKKNPQKQTGNILLLSISVESFR